VLQGKENWQEGKRRKEGKTGKWIKRAKKKSR
jgi:hypothetical protein